MAVSDPTLVYAALAVAGRLTLAEATAGAALWGDEEPATPREAARMLMSYASAQTGRLRVNCPTCDGRGFYRGHKLSHNEAIVVFCDDCEGQGTRLVELDT